MGRDRIDQEVVATGVRGNKSVSDVTVEIAGGEEDGEVGGG